MTVLEDEETSCKTLSLPKRTDKTRHSPQLKRKNSFKFTFQNKKQSLGEMLNGYRTPDYRPNDSIQESPVAGLANTGNTCFLNSVLYTLRFTPTFLHNLHHLIGDLTLVNLRINQNKVKSSSLGRTVGNISGPSSRSTSSKDLLSLGNCSDTVLKPKVQVVTEKLHELFATMHTLEMKESSDAYQPNAFLQAIREVNDIFEGNHQQDAHELLVHLLDNIRTCATLSRQIQNQPELLNHPETSQTSNSKLWNVRRSWKRGNKKKEKLGKDSINEENTNGVTDTEDTNSVDGCSDTEIGYNFIIEGFKGITLRRTKCLECESVTERKEPFYDIPVPIMEDVDISADELYRKACVTSEKLCDSNKYLCDNCKRYNEASREVSFEKLPNIMILQLKRFMTTTLGVQKVNSYMPTPLTLECFCQICCQSQEARHSYQLYCVIMHLGATMASGHYISYVRSSDHFESYKGCMRDLPKGTLSASSSEKSILKFFKGKQSNSSIFDKNSLISSKASGINTCKSIDCCSIHINKNILDNSMNARQNGPQLSADVWLECDDETVKPISAKDFEELLSRKSNPTSTPYLLFYSKITEYD